MKAHELARKLLEMPDLLVSVPSLDRINSSEYVDKVRINEVDPIAAKYLPEEEVRTIQIFGPSGKKFYHEDLY